jgi:hypothetical protein
MSERELVTRVTRPAEKLETAFPLPSDPRFDEHLVALDEGFAPERTGLAPKHRARSLRVLALALLAVLIVLVLTNAAAAAAWELSGGRYVDEIIRENL